MNSKVIIGIAIIVLAAAGAAAFRMYRIYDNARHAYVFVPKDISVTIPEGTNVADMEAILLKAGVLTKQGPFLMAAMAKEGLLFPDTYRFDLGSSPSMVFDRLEANYDKRTGTVNGVSTRAIIIASILEKEVQTETDMRIVAGIIEKRLNAGMPLQLDATVAYGACMPKFRLGQYCDVSQVNLVDNLKRDSAYNTYTRQGLPAGPISNPGLRAIRASLHPQESEYWYYLSAKDGTTIFSKTFQEHQRAKAIYL